MTNPNQYFLLADHIKLSLLERQRAISLKLEPTSQDGYISSSLDSLRDGLESMSNERRRLQEAGETSASLTLQETEHNLRTQYHDLSTQFHGPESSSSTTLTSLTLTQPNDPTLRQDFVRAQERPRIASPSSIRKPSLKDSSANIPTNASVSKSVRFTDTPSSSSSRPPNDPDRSALFPYRDDPSTDDSTVPDQSNLSNQQIHTYHSQVLREQDDALDRLGVSIGRQRELSIQIGDELDEHVMMLDEVDGLVDRTQGRLDKARRGLGQVARKAGKNWQVTTIVSLIIILVLLIVILK